MDYHDMQIVPKQPRDKWEEPMKLPDGFAEFNKVEHLCVALPDHGLTISCRDSKGRMTTFHFGNYSPADEGAPTFLDIQHVGETTQEGVRKGQLTASFEVIGFGPGRDVFDTRKFERSPSLLCIFMDGEENAAKSEPVHASQFTLAYRLKRATALLEAITRENTAAVRADIADFISGK